MGDGVEPNDLIKNYGMVVEFCKISRAARESVTGRKGKKIIVIFNINFGMVKNVM